MTVLAISPEDGSAVAETLTDAGAIGARLAGIGVGFERWATPAQLDPQAAQDEVLAAYAGDVGRLNEKFGFQSVDVVSLHPDHPDKAAFRGKFLAEHTHDDFEIRFFVDGRGLFYLRGGGRVYMLLCERGDLISVPANTRHWFDMGEAPFFKCIRFFTKADGWVGNFTGSDIASRFPDFDRFVAAHA